MALKHEILVAILIGVVAALIGMGLGSWLDRPSNPPEPQRSTPASVFARINRAGIPEVFVDGEFRPDAVTELTRSGDLAVFLDGGYVTTLRHSGD